MIVYIYRFLCGYITIKIFGDFPERFLNICAFNHIILWNIRRKKESIYANVSVRDFFRIRKVKKNRSVHVKIIRKKGVYFTLKPYFSRKGIAVGMVLFFAVIVSLSQFIWNIEVVGNKTLSRNEILKYCDNIGIREGTYSGSIDTNSARLQLLMKNGNLSWASFIIEGSHLTVNVLETKTAKIKDSTPSNLIASKDGVIEKVTVSGGKAVVKKEQAVLKGDMLATGALEYSNGTTHFVRCDGEVLAKTERSIECETPLIIKETIDTGRVERRKVLTIFGIQIPLNFNPINFPYSKKHEINTITNGSSYSPIYVNDVVYKERKSVRIKMNEKDAQKYLEERIKKIEKKELGNIEIISSADAFTVENNRLILKRTYRCIENIAVQEKIKIINVN